MNKIIRIAILACMVVTLLSAQNSALAAENPGWQNFGGSINNTVWASLLDPSGNLFLGGDFTIDPSGVDVGHVSKWNGTSWEKMGLGTDGAVLSFASDIPKNIYTGGAFTKVGGKTVRKVVNRIVRWDTGEGGWNYMQTGANNIVFAVTAPSSNKVYAGGTFTKIGSTGANRVARWNGTTWNNLKTGTSGPVYALAVDSAGNLYAGGNFKSAGGVTVNNIAMWDGSRWSALGGGTSATVRSIKIDNNGNVLVGGYFVTAGGTTVNGIAKWNGATWSAFGSGISSNGGVGTVYSIQTNAANEVFIGGTFINAGGVVVNNIAKWDGASWTALETGVTGAVYTIALDQTKNRLYAAGAFSQDGAKTKVLNRVAYYDLSIVP